MYQYSRERIEEKPRSSLPDEAAPGPFCTFEALLLDVHVVVDVLLAIAVIAVALGAVAEDHVGVVGVGLAADGALVDIALLGVGVLGSSLEVDGLLGMLVLEAALAVADGLSKIAPEEDEEVEDGHDREEGADDIPAQQSGNDLPGEESSVDPGQPLDLDGEDEEQKDLHVRVEGGKGEEEGHVDVVHGGIAGDEAKDDVEHYADQVKHIEPGRSPFPLQKRADPVVEIGRDEGGEETGGLGEEDEGKDPPDLSPKNGPTAEVEDGGKGDPVEGKGVNEGNGHIGNGDIKHEIGDPKPGMLPAELIDPLVDGAQGESLL